MMNESENIAFQKKLLMIQNSIKRKKESIQTTNEKVAEFDLNKKRKIELPIEVKNEEIKLNNKFEIIQSTIKKKKIFIEETKIYRKEEMEKSYFYSKKNEWIKVYEDDNYTLNCTMLNKLSIKTMSVDDYRNQILEFQLFSKSGELLSVNINTQVNIGHVLTLNNFSLMNENDYLPCLKILKYTYCHSKEFQFQYTSGYIHKFFFDYSDEDRKNRNKFRKIDSLKSIYDVDKKLQNKIFIEFSLI
jgi:hypothetical protein